MTAHDRTSMSFIDISTIALIYVHKIWFQFGSMLGTKLYFIYLKVGKSSHLYNTNKKLGRVGIKPSPKRLCTEFAKRQDVIEEVYRRSIALLQI